MKKFIAGILFVFVSSVLHAQTDDTVLMRIGGRKILRSEFEYAYNKNKAQNKMLLADFVQSFIHSKLQVLEAENLGLDTLASFREQMEQLPLAQNKSQDRTSSSVSTDGRPQLRLAHLFIYLPQNSSSKAVQTACYRMDSVYRVISSSGKMFEEYVQEYADKPMNGIYGEQTVLPFNHTMEDVECKIKSLQVGELSRPFVSPAGVHLIQVLEREGDSVEKDTVAVVSDIDEKWDYLWAEWRESLLRASLSADRESQKATPKQLASYFKKNKKRYAWDLPHYKGGILYCKDKSSAKVVKKLLKRVPVEQWNAVVENYNKKNPDKKKVKVESGLFQIGTNPAVDKVVFGQGTFLPSSDFPYVVAVGKKLKKGPESYQDVFGQVKFDYETFRSSEEIARWLKKYKVEINQEVLKTVNNHDNI